MYTKISVVLASYNGERFIEEQLESIASQSTPPDEVIIKDDASTDSTAQKVRDFIEKNSLPGWRIEVNSENRGWKRGFRDLIEEASGDLIFLSDQDDIWKPDKIKHMRKAMESDPRIMVLSSNYEPLYMSPSAPRMNRFYTDPYGSDHIEKVKMDRLWLETRRSGAAMCLNSGVKEFFLSSWSEGFAHDRLLQGIGTALGGFYILNEVLSLHRVHDSNNTPSNEHARKVRMGILKEYVEISERILSLDPEQIKDPGANISPQDEFVKNIDLMNKMNRFWKRRTEAMKSGNPFRFAGLVGSLGLYPKPSSFGADVISTCKGRKE